MKTKLLQKIRNVEQAKNTLYDLWRNGESFHPEDDANSLVGDPFTKEEGDHLNKLMQDINNLSPVDGVKFCPCQFLVDIDLDNYLMGDQPQTCPKCGRRTEFEECKVRTYKYQVHTCDNCNYSFKLTQR